MFLIYEAYNIIEKKSYIGFTSSTLKERKRWHYVNSQRKKATRFFKALQELPKESFIWRVLDTAENKKEAEKKETEYMHLKNSVENGYNMVYTNVPWNKNKKMPEEFCKKFQGENNPMYGKTFSEEERKRRSERMKKCQLGKNNHTARKIYRTSDMKTWDTIIECSRELNIPKSSIQKCCSGKNKTAYGYVFKYCD